MKVYNFLLIVMVRTLAVPMASDASKRGSACHRAGADSRNRRSAQAF